MTGLVSRLRSSAKAFRENSVFDSDGDEVRLIVQADECDEAADRIERLEAGLKGIEELCDEEIKARFSHPHLSIEQCARKSRIYPLLVLPRNLASKALLESKP